VNPSFANSTSGLPQRPNEAPTRLRILLLAPDANPESITGPLISYLQAQALGRLHDVTLVIRSSREEVIRRRQGLIHSVEVARLPRLEGLYAWAARRVFKYNYNSQYLQVLFCLLSAASEWQAWRQLRARIAAGEFDVVLRLSPVPASMPSPLAFLLRRGPVPFVIGPVNGGLPWPAGFSQLKRQKQWISGLRGLFRFLPFARSTYRRAAAIVAGSSHTYAGFAAHREKLFFLPENGVDVSLCSGADRSPERGGKLELIFIGSLIPLKGCDLALRAVALLLRGELAHFTIVGDGSERSRLEQLAKSLGIDEGVSFCGFLSHDEAMRRLRSADVLVFPSLRDFGGGVVFEALALGVVPVVVDFGGPGDIVHPEVGYKVPPTSEAVVVSEIEKILNDLAGNRELLNRLRQRGAYYARECLSWDAKAQTLTSIMRWALRRGPKPDLPAPKMLQLERAR
jgi:glycosyltransferase involved in cell wall biosynthesis